MISYSALKRSEKSLVDRALDMEGGYVLDFSNRTIEEHFEDEFNIEFYSSRYSTNGESKAKRLRAILELHPGSEAARILRNLWEVRSTLPSYREDSDPEIENQTQIAFFKIISKLEGDNPSIDLSTFERFNNEDSLHTLIQSIERDIREDALNAAMDRLHLYCVKRFKHLLQARRIASAHNEPLNSLVGKYAKELEGEGKLSEMSLLFIRYSIAVFEKFNSIRNDRSLAHDNTLLDHREARFVFDAVGSVLRFVKSIDSQFEKRSGY